MFSPPLRACEARWFIKMDVVEILHTRCLLQTWSKQADEVLILGLAWVMKITASIDRICGNSSAAPAAGSESAVFFKVPPKY